MNAAELTALFRDLLRRIETQEKKHADIDDEQKRLLESFNDHRREQDAQIARLEREIALLRQRVDDARATWEEWAARIWAIVGPVIAAVVGYYLGVKR